MDDRVQLHHGDCLDVLRSLPDASVDAVVTDPPYGLEFMGKEWDSPWKDPAAKFRTGTEADEGFRVTRGSLPDAYRAGRPFQQWCEQWATECLRVLKPGGHMLAFGGTRTFHRLACAVEDAGFEIRDSIAWLYGSGFPKSLDVSKAIDKRPGVQRHAEFAAHLADRRVFAGLSRADVSERVVGTRTGACWNWEHHQFPEAKWWPALRDLLDLDESTWGPVIAEAERQKVGKRTTGIGTGNGSVRIMGDGNRDITAPATDDARTWQGWGTALKPAFEPVVVARKPLSGTVAATVLEHGTGALNIDGCRIESDGSHMVKGTVTKRSTVSGDERTGKALGMYGAGASFTPTNHEGGRWPANVVLDEHQAAELDQQSGERPGFSGGGATPGEVSNDVYGKGWQRNPDPSMYGDSGGASRFFYTVKAAADERVRINGTAHPTVKPLSLMRWLVRLVTPPGGTVLEPFAGSGTTVEAALLEGFRCIAIEREADYLPLIRQRINRRVDPVAAVRAEGGDGGLFDLLGEEPA